MPEELRATGIDLLGDVPWGTHFCQFYDTAEDLVDILVPYLKAGLENNEFCMWVCSEPLDTSQARKALKAAVPDLGGYLKKGQIEILRHDEWYVQDGAFDSQRVLDGWVEKLNAALAAGYDGLRIAANMHWLTSDGWADFAAYGQTINSVIGKYRMLAACSYALGKCGAAEIVDVVSNHQFALIRRQGKWQKRENTDRKRAEEALREQRDTAQRYLDLAGVMFVAINTRGEVILINRKGREILGYEEEEIVGKNWFENFIPGASRDELLPVSRKLLSGGLEGVEYFENPVLTKSGEERIIAWHNTVLRGQEGDIIGHLSSGEDITDRNRAEQAMRESEERYRTVVEGAAEGILVADVETKKFLYANPAVCEMLGYSEEELTAMGVSDLHPEAFLGEVLAMFEAQARAEEALVEGVPCLRKDGTLIYANINTAPATIDGRPCNVGFFTDVTERRQAKAEIQSLARFPSENPYPVLRIAADGAVLYANLAGSGLLRAHDSRVGGQLPPSWRECRATAIASGSVERREVRQDGKVYALSFVPVPGGEYVNIYGTDVTGQKQAEDQFRQAQKMEAFGQLAGGVAHDFRNQLAIIRGYSEMLLRQSLVTGEGSEMVEEILKAAGRSAVFTGQLLAFSRKEILRPEVKAVCDLVADMAEPMRKMVGEDVALSILPCERPCLAMLDPGMFHQSLVNLAANARDAMPAGGTLTIKIESVEVGAPARRPDARPDRYVMVSVTDTGEGMDEPTKARAFEPFFTTKEVGKGTGLGLSMVHGFVNQSGGFVELDSEPGEGSTFRLYFPAAGSAVEPAAPRPAGEEAAGGTETILVAEDEEALRRMVISGLRESGYTVLEAADAREAMRHIGSEGRIDMLVTDVVMPGESGVGLAGRFRDARPAAPVLYVSGYSGDDLSRRGVDHDRTDILTKPFSQDELLIAVRVALDAAKRAPTDA